MKLGLFFQSYIPCKIFSVTPYDIFEVEESWFSRPEVLL
jgi:hypothetical protein